MSLDLSTRKVKLEKNICDHKESIKYALLLVKLQGECYSTIANNCMNMECKCHEYIKNKAILEFLNLNKDLKLVKESKNTIDKLCEDCSTLNIETKFYLFETKNCREEAKDALQNINMFFDGEDYKRGYEIMLFDIDFYK